VGHRRGRLSEIGATSAAAAAALTMRIERMVETDVRWNERTAGCRPAPLK